MTNKDFVVKTHSELQDVLCTIRGINRKVRARRQDDDTLTDYGISTLSAIEDALGRAMEGIAHAEAEAYFTAVSDVIPWKGEEVHQQRIAERKKSTI